MTGKDGSIRQIGSAEIVAPVALARSLRPVKKVVFMSMGEPAHKLDNVTEAIELLGTVDNIGHKNLVSSTVGDERSFERSAPAVPTAGMGESRLHRCTLHRAGILTKLRHSAEQDVDAGCGQLRARSLPVAGLSRSRQVIDLISISQ